MAIATVGAALEFARNELHEDSEYAARDAVLLLAHALGRPPSYPHLHPEGELTPEQEEVFRSLISRRKTGEPVAYLRGRQEFMGLEFSVDRRVLIPRPETEILVEAAIADLGGAQASTTSHTVKLLAAFSAASYAPPPEGKAYHIADICCGCGAIGLSLARMLKDAHVVLSDLSDGAVAVARENAGALGVADRTEFLSGDLAAPFVERGMSGTFDLVVSNPPYIAREELPALPRDVRGFEPRLALDGGPGGLHFIERLAAEAWPLLKPGRLMFMEIGSDQGAACQRIFAAAGHWAPGQVMRDYAGRERVFRVRKR